MSRRPKFWGLSREITHGSSTFCSPLLPGVPPKVAQITSLWTWTIQCEWSSEFSGYTLTPGAFKYTTSHHSCFESLGMCMNPKSWQSIDVWTHFQHLFLSSLKHHFFFLQVYWSQIVILVFLGFFFLTFPHEFSHENGNFMTVCHSYWSLTVCCSVWLVADPLGTLKSCSRDFWNNKSGSHLLDSPWLWLNHHSVARQGKCYFIFEPSGGKDFNRHEWKFSLKGNMWVAPHSWSFKIVPWVGNHNHYALQISEKVRRGKKKLSELRMSKEGT